MKFFKTVIIFALKIGMISHDPFINFRFQVEKVDRGFLTDEEIQNIMRKTFVTPRLEQVRDIFIFSCFTGLAYIDMVNLTESNIVVMDEKKWIVVNRHKTNVPSNILLLDIPLAIIDKYKGKSKNGRLLPILSNQKMNAYLKEIADVCGINKRLTCHLARHSIFYFSLKTSDLQNWKNRPLEYVYPIVWLDAVHYKVMDDKNRAVTRAIYNVLALTAEGKKELLGMYISKSEGANFWLNVLTDLQNRGVQYILIACVDGLKGFPKSWRDNWERLSAYFRYSQHIRRIIYTINTVKVTIANFAR